MKTTQQVPNPTGKGGFGDNPGNRNPGGWNKEESISYWYNKIGRMTDEEIEAFIPANQNQKIALKRVKDAYEDLPTTKEITDRTEGKAPQSIDVTTQGDSIKSELPEEVVKDFATYLKDKTKE